MKGRCEKFGKKSRRHNTTQHYSILFYTAPYHTLICTYVSLAVDGFLGEHGCPLPQSDGSEGFSFFRFHTLENWRVRGRGRGSEGVNEGK